MSEQDYAMNDNVLVDFETRIPRHFATLTKSRINPGEIV
jgi:hypothetical protein